ncbi:MAG: hypothetical protein ABJF88_16960 [Rhodothermales bacterium]
MPFAPARAAYRPLLRRILSDVLGREVRVQQVPTEGGVERSRYLDALAIIWITHAMRSGGGGHAFKLLQKST